MLLMPQYVYIRGEFRDLTAVLVGFDWLQFPHNKIW